MTDAVATPDGGWWRRAATWLAHQQPAVVVLSTGVYVLAAVMPSVTTAVLSWFATLALIVTVTSEWFHLFALCPRCARSIPLDGEVQAVQRSDWLRLHHLYQHVWWGRFLLITLAGAAVLALHVPSMIALAPLYVSWVVEAIANLRHRPLQPWCPQCRWWDDGDDEEVPVMPVPPRAEVSR